MTDTDRRKAMLEARLAELGARMNRIDDELESHNNRDWEELAVERETDEVLEDLGLSAQEEARAINAALARIEAGEYGDCVECGAPIAAERLDVLPYTPFCSDCAARHAG